MYYVHLVTYIAPGTVHLVLEHLWNVCVFKLILTLALTGQH